jgi:hypothetical protein
MRIIASWSLVTLLAVGLAGCVVEAPYGGQGWNDPACQDGQGRVDMRRWQAIVDDFLSSSYRGKDEFQRAKRQLLGDLDGVRDRACSWERGSVERLWLEVRDFRYRDTWD